MLALLGTGSMGCAPKFHVLAELDQALPTIPPNAAISVQTDPEAPSALHADVARRIEHLLTGVAGGRSGDVVVALAQGGLR